MVCVKEHEGRVREGPPQRRRWGAAGLASRGAGLLLGRRQGCQAGGVPVFLIVNMVSFLQDWEG